MTTKKKQIISESERQSIVLNWLKSEFETIENVIDVFGRKYNATPFFILSTVKKNDFRTQTEIVDGIKFRYRQYSPMSQTKSYTIFYEILK